MNQQRRLSKHNGRQSSIGETASVGSAKSARSNGSADNPSPTSHGTSNKKSNWLSKHGSKDSCESGQFKQANILNVAEMILHGVADNEILEIWLRSINCEEFVPKFIDAGYDMPTISRITPQDLTAIGVTEPTKRLKILTEIKKLNLQDGIPNFMPASLSHWLSLIRLDSYYYKSLCEQQIDTIEKLCQLTWEDFEELGISKLGHQKRFQIAIERVKELEAEMKCPIKANSEPIYDTNPSQILLVASAENHSMNGPIINKQSSTSELSSTGSGSMHSVYSTASTQYQSSYASLPDNQKSSIVNQMSNVNHTQVAQNQTNLSQPQQNHQPAIYNQPPSATVYQQPAQLAALNQQHYYRDSTTLLQAQLQSETSNGPNSMMGFQAQNRQSMGQLPFSALAKLPKHQQQLLQQSCIYATLGRQPSKVKQPPPPVPIRTNSLKSNSLCDDTQLGQQHSHLNGSSTNSTINLFRSGTRVSNNNTRGQYSPQTMLTKNKSFSGNAHMEASRARFLNRNSQSHFPQQQFQTTLNQTNCNNQNFISINQMNGASMDTNRLNGYSPGRETFNSLQQQLASDNYNHPQQLKNSIQNNQQPSLPKSLHQTNQNNGEKALFHGDDFDVLSDTTSTKSLIIQSSSALVNAPLETQTNFSTPTYDSGSSQTLYKSISSGSNDQSLYNFSHTGESVHNAALTASSCTLNDASSAVDRQRSNYQSTLSDTKINPGPQCNATTGKDDDFPPPPSPLSSTDFDEQDMVSLNQDSTFTDISHGLMTFRVGI